MKNITDLALSLLLDNDEVMQYVDQQATELLGRGMKPAGAFDEQDDPEWWTAKTKVMSELLEDMSKLNELAAPTMFYDVTAYWPSGEPSLELQTDLGGLMLFLDHVKSIMPTRESKLGFVIEPTLKASDDLTIASDLLESLRTVGSF